MKKIMITCAVCLAVSGNAGAQGFLNKIKNAVDKVAKTTEKLAGKEPDSEPKNTAAEKKATNSAKYQIHKTAATKTITLDGGVYHMYPFSDGMACVVGTNKYLFINTEGDIVFELDQKDVEREGPDLVFDSGRMIVMEETSDYKKNIVIYDKTGKKIKTIPYAYEATQFMDGVALIDVYSENSSDSHKHYIDTNGNYVFPGLPMPAGVTREIYPLRDGRARIHSGGKWGFRDGSGNLPIPLKFTEAHDFCNGLAAVKDENDKWGFIDTSGQYVIRPIYSREPGDYHSGYIRVTDKSNTHFFIDKTGTIKHTFEGNPYDFSDDGYCCVSTFSSYLMDTSFKKILDMGQYAEIVYSENKTFRQKISYYAARITDISGNLLLEGGVDDFPGGFCEGLAIIKDYKTKIKGYINKQGEVVVCFEDTQF